MTSNQIANAHAAGVADVAEYVALVRAEIERCQSVLADIRANGLPVYPDWMTAAFGPTTVDEEIERLTDKIERLESAIA